jgi:hypothetical protein
MIYDYLKILKEEIGEEDSSKVCTVNDIRLSKNFKRRNRGGGF